MAREQGNRKAPLSKAVNQRRNTQQGRAQMAPNQFALPGKRYRMDTLAHAKNARARVAQYGTPAEKRRVYEATARKYPSLKGTRPK